MLRKFTCMMVILTVASSKISMRSYLTMHDQGIVLVLCKLEFAGPGRKSMSEFEQAIRPVMRTCHRHLKGYIRRIIITNERFYGKLLCYRTRRLLFANTFWFWILLELKSAFWKMQLKNAVEIAIKYDKRIRRNFVFNLKIIPPIVAGVTWMGRRIVLIGRSIWRWWWTALTWFHWSRETVVILFWFNINKMGGPKIELGRKISGILCTTKWLEDNLSK